MTVPYLTKPAIERHVAQIYSDALAAGVSSGAPVNVDFIVEFVLGYDLHMGASLPPGVLGSTDGRKQVIYIADNIENEGRQRFTVAHEIGHVVMHFPFLLAQAAQPALFERVAGPVQDDRMEWQADYFAAALLMPRELLLERYGDAARAGAPIDPTQVADAFGVSRQAATIRLEELLMLLRTPPGEALAPWLC